MLTNIMEHLNITGAYKGHGENRIIGLLAIQSVHQNIDMVKLRLAVQDIDYLAANK